MSDTKTKAETTAKKVDPKVADKMIDPKATAPSKDPARADRDNATATEPNSAQRVAEKKASRTGRGNGGGGDAAANYPRPGLNTDLTADTLGEREAVSPAETDAIWTNASKDRWGADQPSLGDMLAQRAEIEKQRREQEK